MSRRIDLPSSWTYTTLGAICSKPQYGWTTSAEKSGDGVRLLRTTDITSGSIDWSTVPICRDVPDDVGKYQLHPGDIVISRAGSVGYSHLLRDVPGPAVFASYLIRFRPRDSVDARYLSHFLWCNDYWSQISEQSAGIALANVNARKLEEIELPLAPLPEQRRIVAKIEELFSDLDAGVAALKRVKANLKRYRAAVLKAAVEGRLTAEWRKAHPDVEPASKLLERIFAERRAKWEAEQLRKYAEKGKQPPKGWREKYKAPADHEEEYLPTVPGSWTWTSLGAFAWHVSDGPHHTPKYSPHGIPFVTGGHVRADAIDFSRAKYISAELHAEFSKRCRPEVGDLLYTKGGTTGIAHIVRDSRPFSVWVHVAVLKLSSHFDKRYLQMALSSPICYKQSQKYTHGVGNQDLGLTRMVKIAVPLPPATEQAEIVAEVDRRISVVDAAEAQVEHALQRAARLRQAILKRAFEGKLVPQDPSDEPVGVMLERIRAGTNAPEPEARPKRRQRSSAKSRGIARTGGRR